MLDWFDEPLLYFAHFAPMRARVFDHMARWMDSVDRAMEEEFGEFYDSFLNDGRNATNTTLPVNATNSNETIVNQTVVNATDANQTQVNQTADEDEDFGFYSITSSMYSGDGFQHIYREEQDSKTGKTKVVETKRIGNKSITIHRVTDKDGNVEEHETRKNIKDNELEAFNKDWDTKNVPKHSSLPEGEKKEEQHSKQPLESGQTKAEL